MDLQDNSKIWPKMKKFENFFDVHMDTSVIVDNTKKILKIFNFWSNFVLNRKGRP